MTGRTFIQLTFDPIMQLPPASNASHQGSAESNRGAQADQQRDSAAI